MTASRTWTLRSHPCVCRCGCAQPFIGHPNAGICPACKPHAALLRGKAWRLQRVTADPDYYRKQTPAKRAAKQRWKAAHPPPPLLCAVCYCRLPRIRGRTTRAMCTKDQRLQRWRRNQARKKSAAA